VRVAEAAIAISLKSLVSSNKKQVLQIKKENKKDTPKGNQIGMLLAV